MPNTCTICRHEKRAEIEDQLVRGVPFRSIGKAYQTTHATLNRHRSCIADELRKLKTSRSVQLGETLQERLDRYRGVTENISRMMKRLCLPLTAATSKLT
jgi:hypothetical protein